MNFKILDRVCVKDIDEVLTVVDYKHIFGIAKERTLAYTLSDTSGCLYDYEDYEIELISRPIKKSKYDYLKMYVLVKNTAPIGLGINSVGHVTYSACKKFDSQIHKEWETYSNRQVTCLVSEEEFKQAIEEIEKIGGKYVLFNENDWNDQDISVAFEARYNFPDIFKTFKLHSGG